MPIARPVRPRGPFLVLSLLLLLGPVACDSSPSDSDDDDHVDSQRVELHTRGPSPVLVATWDAEHGWEDAQENPIDELSELVEVEDEGLQPLRAGGAHAALTVSYFFADGSPVPMATASQDGETGERVCTEYAVRYYPIDDATDVIAWPNIAHPESDGGAAQFARRADQELVGIFHCDHVHIYPELEGTTELEFHLWHLGHSDGSTEPLTLRVES